MTIKPSLTAVAVACLLVLVVAPAANAQERSAQPTNTKTEKTSEKKSDENTKKEAEAPAAPEPAIVTVQAGDTLESIAATHGTTYVQLFNANPGLANPDMIDVGNQVRIPAADEQLADRYSEFAAQQAVVTPVVQASAESYPVYSQTYTPGAQAVYATDSNGNTYFKGYCTWYAKERRPDLPNMLGNGGQWVANAAARGIATGNTPRVGAVAETSGHVAYVEAVNADGTITISEMNGTAGFGAVGSRNVPASQYNYIY